MSTYPSDKKDLEIVLMDHICIVLPHYIVYENDRPFYEGILSLRDQMSPRLSLRLPSRFEIQYIIPFRALHPIPFGFFIFHQLHQTVDNLKNI